MTEFIGTLLKEIYEKVIKKNKYAMLLMAFLLGLLSGIALYHYVIGKYDKYFHRNELEKNYVSKDKYKRLKSELENTRDTLYKLYNNTDNSQAKSKVQIKHNQGNININ